MSSLIIVNTLQSQVSLRMMGYESTAEINWMLVDNSNWNLRAIRTSLQLYFFTKVVEV